MKKYGGLLGLITILAAVVTGCGEEQNDRVTSAAKPEVETIQVAHTQNSKPMNYVNEKGESDGYEVQVLKLVDELLPQYQFEFVPTSDDDLLIGIESGKYDLGTKGAWFTEERAQKFVFPQNYIGASSIGLLIRQEDSDKVKDLESFAKNSGKLVPIAPNNAQYNVIQEYNKEHPDNQIGLEASDSFDVADAYNWVLEGRYDGFFVVKTAYQKNILDPGAPYGQYADKLSYVVHRSLPTWPLFNKSRQDLADAYDEAFLKLKESGKVNEVMLKYLGEDTFQYVQK